MRDDAKADFARRAVFTGPDLEPIRRPSVHRIDAGSSSAAWVRTWKPGSASTETL